jgi:LPXTG-site transpeptidase (sortase) family protein
MITRQNLRRFLAPGLLASVLALAPLVPSQLQSKAASANALPAGIAEPFVTSWQSLNGADLLGSPVSPPVQIDGHLMQFFAYGALISDDGGKVSRYEVGPALAKSAHDPERTVAGRRVGSDPGMAAFAVNPKYPFAISRAIADSFDANKGEERFGAPISRSYTSNGQRIQWFEYGKLVWDLDQHDGVATFVGWELARQLDVPVSREIPELIPTLPETIDEATNDPVAATGFSPSHISIPSVGIDASIEDVEIVDGVMQTPVDVWSVGWYQQLAQPGGAGNAVFAAHRDYWGVGPTIFYNLDQVSIGDQIYVAGPNGEQVSYTITDLYSVDASADFSSVISQSGDGTITLITCTGTFDGAEYLERLVVRGVLNGAESS